MSMFKKEKSMTDIINIKAEKSETEEKRERKIRDKISLKLSREFLDILYEVEEKLGARFSFIQHQDCYYTFSIEGVKERFRGEINGFNTEGSYWSIDSTWELDFSKNSFTPDTIYKEIRHLEDKYNLNKGIKLSKIQEVLIEFGTIVSEYYQEEY